jgi:hypothetical protein
MLGSKRVCIRIFTKDNNVFYITGINTVSKDEEILKVQLT